MSRKLKYGLTFGSLFILGYGSSWVLSQMQSDHEQNRIVASASTTDSRITIEKHLMPLVLTVQGPESYPTNPEKTVKLKGTIRTPFPGFTNINYKWILPDEVDVIQGYMTSDITNPIANQLYEVEITVKGFNSLERKEISLIATTIDPNGTRLGNSAVITSRPEDSMEHLAPVMMVKAQEFKASQVKERMPASEDAQ